MREKGKKHDMFVCTPYRVENSANIDFVQCGPWTNRGTSLWGAGLKGQCLNNDVFQMKNK